jgi:hypothetical protein
VAQALLDDSVTMGGKRVATRHGVAFVAQCHNVTTNAWHGYPEAWDAITVAVKREFLTKGQVTKRDFGRWATFAQIKRAWEKGN